ncbi:hydroxymethylglutaryl-CoA lyase [Trypanosoma cruzi]|nr:hydroxymethylglutaryl-CoA lyase [Trypanosoma cruzi]
MFSSRFFLAPIRLVECPRDAMQGLSHFIPTAQKILYLNALLKCGFYSIDCASFVSPRAVPQMRDSAEVLAGCNHALLTGEDAPKLSVVVASHSGFKRALETPIVSTIGFPLSCSERFQQLNTKKSIAEALNELTEMQKAVVDTNAALSSSNGMSLELNKKRNFLFTFLCRLVTHMGNRVVQKWRNNLSRIWFPWACAQSVSLIPLAYLSRRRYMIFLQDCRRSSRMFFLVHISTATPRHLKKR